MRVGVRVMPGVRGLLAGVNSVMVLCSNTLWLITANLSSAMSHLQLSSLQT